MNLIKQNSTKTSGICNYIAIKHNIIAENSIQLPFFYNFSNEIEDYDEIFKARSSQGDQENAVKCQPTNSTQPEYNSLYRQASQAYNIKIRQKKIQTIKEKKRFSKFIKREHSEDFQKQKKKKINKEQANPWRKYSLRYPQVPLKMLCQYHSIGQISKKDKCQARSYIIRQLSRVEALNNENQNFLLQFAKQYIGLLQQLKKDKQQKQKNSQDKKKKVSIGKGIEEIQLAQNVVRTYFQNSPYVALLQIYRVQQKIHKKASFAYEELKTLRKDQLGLQS